MSAGCNQILSVLLLRHHITSKKKKKEHLCIPYRRELIFLKLCFVQMCESANKYINYKKCILFNSG